jgi:hypothetical protein
MTDEPRVLPAVVADLSSQEVEARATRSEDRGLTTSQWAARSGVHVAVNGNPFRPAALPLLFVPRGLAIGGGAPWDDSNDGEREAFIAFDRARNRNGVHLSPPEDVVARDALSPDWTSAVGGWPMLLRAGVVQVFDCSDAETAPCERAPRTAVGASADGGELYLVVVDGRGPASLGATASELAFELAALGASDGFLLDGGGASTLYIAAEGGVVNAPSDGAERPAANHLGLVYGELPPGTVLGFVRQENVITGSDIPDARVVLDDGQERITDGRAFYSFDNIRPRRVCATASKRGFRSATRCVEAASNEQVWDSIALFPGEDTPDASAPADARPPVADGGPDAPAEDATAGGADGAPFTDGGARPAGGGCSAARLGARGGG